MTEELKPCPLPWCGGDARIGYFETPRRRKHYVKCLSCGCQTPQEGSRVKAISAWQQRSPQPAEAVEPVAEIIAWLRTEEGKGSDDGADYASCFADTIERRWGRASPQPDLVKVLEAAANELAELIEQVEQDRIDDANAAEDSGERPDLWGYEVCLDLDKAKSICAALMQVKKGNG